ncbi:olfactory receptor 10A6-like [Centropristis striata]|uniref:olfactory receptor 10A6-like n=1 Tax=Centropristis striata TaxID=184440 RepID=UPI0027DFE361|nr:olfactory receptor 10A6-like [Centropristis striata]
MLNSTSSTLSYLVLGAYLHVGNLKYIYFMITAMLYLLIVIVNTSLIVVICVNRSLHEPMYIFLCSLFVNELYGSTGLFPFLLVQILSDIHTVSASFCFLQIFCLHTYVNIEFCNLAIMSYDRYLAICFPLQYNTRMTFNKAIIFIIVVWLYSFLKFLIPLSLNIRLTRCGNIINGLFCRNYLVVNLACSDIKLNNIYGLFGTAVTILVPLLTILFSYVKIFKVCFSGSKQTRQKAVSTCTPHIASLLNFSCAGSFEIIQTRFDMSSVPSELRIILSLYFVIIPLLLNPVMFGLQMSKILNTFKHYQCHRSQRLPTSAIADTVAVVSTGTSAGIVVDRRADQPPDLVGALKADWPHGTQSTWHTEHSVMSLCVEGGVAGSSCWQQWHTCIHSAHFPQYLSLVFPPDHCQIIPLLPGMLSPCNMTTEAPTAKVAMDKLRGERDKWKARAEFLEEKLLDVTTERDICRSQLSGGEILGYIQDMMGVHSLASLKEAKQSPRDDSDDEEVQMQHDNENNSEKDDSESSSDSVMKEEDEREDKEEWEEWEEEKEEREKGKEIQTSLSPAGYVRGIS